MLGCWWIERFWSIEAWRSQVLISCQYIVPITHQQYIHVSSNSWISPVIPISSRLVHLWRFSFFAAHTACRHALHNVRHATAETLLRAERKGFCDAEKEKWKRDRYLYKTFHLGDVVHRNISQVVATWEVSHKLSRKLILTSRRRATRSTFSYEWRWETKLNGMSSKK